MRYKKAFSPVLAMLLILTVALFVGCGDRTVTPTNVTPDSVAVTRTECLTEAPAESSSSKANTETSSASAQTVSQSSSSKAEAPADEPVEEIRIYTIGVVQWNETFSSQEAVYGFRDGLGTYLESDGRFVVENAKGDFEACRRIINNFIKDGVDLIMTEGAFATQYAAGATKQIPIVSLSVADYPSLLTLNTDANFSGSNVTGSSNAVSLTVLADMVNQLIPTAQTIGILSFSEDSDITFQNKAAKKAFENKGYTLNEYSTANVSEIATLTQTACDNNDVLVIVDDPVAAANTQTIDKICKDAGVPVVTCDQTILDGCGAVGYCPDDYELGLESGQLAYKILILKQDPGQLEFVHPISLYHMYNHQRCQALGIHVPAEYEPLILE